MKKKQSSKLKGRGGKSEPGYRGPDGLKTLKHAATIINSKHKWFYSLI
jgi:hypothetical protein